MDSARLIRPGIRSGYGAVSSRGSPRADVLRCATTVTPHDEPLRLTFGILGSVEVLAGGRPIALGGTKQRALLAVLILHAGEAVSADRLIEELWGANPHPAHRRSSRRQ